MGTTHTSMTEFVQPLDTARHCFACDATLLPWQRFFCSPRCNDTAPVTPELGRRFVEWWAYRKSGHSWREE